MDSLDSRHMAIALREAEDAARRDEVPVGAVIVDGNTKEIVARAGNRVELLKDPTAHAEMQAIRKACAALGQKRLDHCDLYVTLEPCAMCATAIAHARIRRVYFGAYDPKGGAVENGPRIFDQPTCHHKPDIYGGIGESASAELLVAFFKKKR
ncbi:MAG: nucleoside deaminase [Proteobacteria bacterium]|nr:nucleoside deaminase [Pseudomonadota bacterium]